MFGRAAAASAFNRGVTRHNMVAHAQEILERCCEHQSLSERSGSAEADSDCIRGSLHKLSCAKDHAKLAMCYLSNCELRLRDSAAIASISGKCLTLRFALAHAKLLRFCGIHCAIVFIAAADIADRSGLLTYHRFDTDHAILDKPCEPKSDSRGMAAAAIEANRLVNDNPHG